MSRDKKRKKKLVAFLLIILSCVALAYIYHKTLDCAESQTSIEENNMSAVFNDEQYAVSSSGNEKNDMFESYANEERYENLSITDNVRIELMNHPISDFDEMPSFTVKYMSIPEQSLRSLFSCNNREEGPIPVYTSDRGDKLTISAAEAVYYETNDYDKYSYFLPIDDEINDMSNYFVHDTDLDFCSSEDALEQINSILSSIGISPTNSRIIAMDQDSLNDAQKIIEKSLFWQSETKTRQKKYARTWSKREECYVVVAEQSFNGYPVDATFCRSATDKTRFPTRVVAMVDSSGVIGMKITGMYSVVSKEANKPVIDYKMAVKALTDYYAQSISEKKLCFVRAELKLVAMERKNEIVLSPMWIFSSTDEGASPDEIQARNIDEHLFITRVYVDAYTGEVISR